MSKVRMLEKALNAGRIYDRGSPIRGTPCMDSKPKELVKEVEEKKAPFVEPIEEEEKESSPSRTSTTEGLRSEVGKNYGTKRDNFKGTKKGVGRAKSIITVDDLLKRGQLIEREMRNGEAQQGKTGRHKELHLQVGKGIINTTRLIRDNKLTVKRLKGEEPLRKAVHVSDDLKNAILDYWETGNIDDELNDLDQGKLYAFIADLEHYGNVTPEEFYRDKMLGILKRAELAPINPNLKSQFENLLSIARELKIVSKVSERYLEERAKSVFRYR